MPTRQGSFHLFRILSIDVYLHWSWFLIAAIELSQRTAEYHSPAWNILEYLCLFLIVLTHEFGHALACRSVGGVADQVVLWPLGGVAYVSPPQRAGATLWTIFAGPLVNIVLAPLLWLLPHFLTFLGFGDRSYSQDLYQFLHNIIWINIFNFLNKQLKISTFPSADPVEAFELAAFKNHYAVVDAIWGYTQFAIDKETKKMLTICSKSGVYEWQRMPFGPAPAPAEAVREE
jgi:hypothetical protein